MLINQLNVRYCGVSLMTQPNINHSSHILNLLELDKGYIDNIGTNQFIYLDKTREANITPMNQIPATDIVAMAVVGGGWNHVPPHTSTQNAKYNEGFHSRQKLPVTNRKAKVDVPLRRYGLFKSLEDNIIPNLLMTFEITLKNDDVLICKGGDAVPVGAVIVKDIRLWIPRLKFNMIKASMMLETY